MPDQEDLLFIKTAFQKGYLRKEAIADILQHLREYEKRGRHVKVVDYLFFQSRSRQTPLLTSQQIGEVQEICRQGQVQPTMPAISGAEMTMAADGNCDSAETTMAADGNCDSAETTVATDGNCDSAETTAVVSGLSSTVVQGQRDAGSGAVNEKTGVLENLFGHYRIDRELGRGGMGIVYQAHDLKLQRTVALKVLLQTQEVSDVHLQRFIREAQSIAQIRHANIISVFDVGDTPQPYFTMEYIEGQDLATLIKNGQLKPAQTAQILEKVAEALYSVHRQGIIHRDIKPSNIMVASHGEPKLMDFGLAKTQDANLSQGGDFLGTPAYMSPEQVNNQTVDARSDVYSLGATLYQALTGRGPFQGDTIYNIIYQICNKDPVSPRMLNPDINPDLEAICLKCMEKLPSKRYPSARMLAKDLQNFLGQKPIMAKPATRLTHLKKWVMRNKAIAGVSLALLITIIFGLASFIWIQGNALRKEREAKRQIQEKEVMARESAVEAKKQAQRAEDNAQRAKDNAQRAEANALLILQEMQRANKNLYYAYIGLAEKYSEEYDVTLAEKALQGCPADQCQWEWYWLRRQLHGEIRSNTISQLYMSRSPHCKCCFFPPDTKNIVVLVDLEAGGWSCKREVTTLDRDLRVLEKIEIRDTTGSWAFSPDGKFLAYVKSRGDQKPDAGENSGESNGKELLVQELKTGDIVFRQEDDYVVTSFNFSPDGKKLAVAARDYAYKVSRYQITIWDIEKNKKIKQFARQDGWLKDISYCGFSPDGATLLYSCYYKEPTICRYPIKLWDWEKEKSPRTLEEKHNERINQCVYSPDGKIIVSASNDDTIMLWDGATGRFRNILLGHKDDVKCCVISPDGKQLASASSDNTVKIWDLRTMEVLYTLRGHDTSVASCTFTPDGRYVVSGDRNGTVKLWDIQQNSVPLTAHSMAAFYDCAFNKDGRVWHFDMDGGYQTDFDRATVSQPLREVFAGKGCPVPEQATIVTVDPGKKWRITGDSGREYPVIKQGEKLAVYSGNFVVVAAEQLGVKLLDIRSGESLMVRPMLHQGEGSSCALSDDGKTIVAGSEKGVLSLWNVADKNPFHLQAHKDDINCLAVYDTVLVSGSDDGRVKIWDLSTIADTRQPVKDLNHGNMVNACAFSGDGKMLLTAGSDAVLCWDVAGGDTLYYLSHHAVVGCVAFARGDSLILAGGEDFTHGLRLWDFTPKKISDLDARMWNDPATDRRSYLFRKLAECGVKLDATALFFCKNRWMITDAVGQRQYTVVESKDGVECYRTGSYVSLLGHRASITSCAVSPDGRRFVSGSYDNTLKIWDAVAAAELLRQKNAAQGQATEQNPVRFMLEPILTLKEHTNTITSCTFSPDGKAIVSSSQDHTVKIWEAPDFVPGE